MPLRLSLMLLGNATIHYIQSLFVLLYLILKVKRKLHTIFHVVFKELHVVALFFLYITP